MHLLQVDLLDEAVLSAAEAEALAKRLGMKLYRTCVLDNLLVDEVFQYLAEQCIEEKAHLEEEPAEEEAAQEIAEPQSVSLSAPSKVRTGGKKNCC